MSSLGRDVDTFKKQLRDEIATVLGSSTWNKSGRTTAAAEIISMIEVINNIDASLASIATSLAIMSNRRPPNDT